MSQKWAWLTTSSLGEQVTIRFGQVCVRFDDPKRASRSKPPAASSVQLLADDILRAPDHIRAAILLHYTYWPSMVHAVLVEMQRRAEKRRRHEQQQVRMVKRRRQREEADVAPHASLAPAVIPLSDGSLHGGAHPIPPAPASPAPVMVPDADEQEDEEHDEEPDFEEGSKQAESEEVDEKLLEGDAMVDLGFHHDDLTENGNNIWMAGID